MAIKNIIASGIGFNPGSVKYIPTRGFDSATPPVPPDVRWNEIHRGRILGSIDLVYPPYIVRRY